MGPDWAGWRLLEWLLAAGFGVFVYVMCWCFLQYLRERKERKHGRGQVWSSLDEHGPGW